MSGPVLRIEHLTKMYRAPVKANDDISVHIHAGDVVGLLGHNGAGKTTLINQIIGLVKPSSGSIAIDGRDAIADPAMARKACAVQPQSHAPLDGLTPLQAIALMGRIRGLGRRQARQRAYHLMDALDIAEWSRTRGEQLSGGVQRLTAFCMAAAAPASAIMLDEPTNDVDPVRRRLLWTQIRALGDDGCAVLLVTHNVVEAERAVDRLVVLDHGRVVAEGTPSQLRGRHSRQLRLDFTAAISDDAVGLATEIVTDEPPTVSGRRVRVVVSSDYGPTAIEWAWARRRSGRIEEFSITPVGLEDIYVHLIDSEGRGTTDHAGLVA